MASSASLPNLIADANGAWKRAEASVEAGRYDEARGIFLEAAALFDEAGAEPWGDDMRRKSDACRRSAAALITSYMMREPLRVVTVGGERV